MFFCVDWVAWHDDSFRISCVLLCFPSIVHRSVSKKRASSGGRACWRAWPSHVVWGCTYVPSLFFIAALFVCWLFGNFLKNSGNWRRLHDNFWEPVGKFCKIDGLLALYGGLSDACIYLFYLFDPQGDAFQRGTGVSLLCCIAVYFYRQVEVLKMICTLKVPSCKVLICWFSVWM